MSSINCSQNCKYSVKAW